MNVDSLLDVARGPLFRFAFFLMLLGLARHVVFAIWGIAEALYKAHDRKVAYNRLARDLIEWIIPVHRLHRSRPIMSYVSFVFHIGVIIVPIFLVDHIYLIYQSTGIGWPGIPRPVADVLTLIALVACVILLCFRMFSMASHYISGAMDYILLIVIAGIFLTGFIAARSYNPVPYQTTMFVHVLLGNCLFILVPFTKLTHCVLYPLIRISSYVAWKFPPRAGKEVAATIFGNEDKPV